MKKLFLPLSLFSLLFSLACGSSGVTGFIPKPKGNFSDASLNGQYVYQISGTDSRSGASVPYYETGVFSASGNGTLTNVTDDFEGDPPVNTISTGAYSINNDGTGSLTFRNSFLGTITLAVTMVNSSKAYFMEADPFLNASGIAEQQKTTALPSGTFAFRKHSVGGLFSRSSGAVGAFKVASDGSLTGSEDVLWGEALSSATIICCSLTSPDSTTGRGTGSFADSSGLSSTFVYYTVDPNNIRFLFLDDAPPFPSGQSVGIGRAEMQSGTPALSGSYAFGGRGDTVSSGVNGINTVGAFTASGGTITAGAIDSVKDGTSFYDQAITTGNYSQTSNGRATVTLNASGTFGALQATVWMVSPARGFFLVTNGVFTVEDDTLDLQSGSFSNATMNGQFAFLMDGFDATLQLLDRLGTLQWDGNSKLILNEVAHSSATGAGARSPGVLSGTYSVSSNGRAIGTINNLSLTNGDLVFYLISGSDAYLLQNDSGVEINGMISLQH